MSRDQPVLHENKYKQTQRKHYLFCIFLSHLTSGRKINLDAQRPDTPFAALTRPPWHIAKAPNTYLSLIPDPAPPPCYPARNLLIRTFSSK
ncbi:unnamed protein product [Periconia digitata]|uniref:Uncharacterized protein n=1 Tax=Periconia digitata TaxID=1303443 RepID=A0A9W4UB11_9PLEO|nr:unnamed protein product [Periconia digitata]